MEGDKVIIPRAVGGLYPGLLGKSGGNSTVVIVLPFNLEG